jgi:hypothetical protein
MAHAAWVTMMRVTGVGICWTRIVPITASEFAATGFSHGLQELRTKARTQNTNRLNYGSLIRAM